MYFPIYMYEKLHVAALICHETPLFLQSAVYITSCGVILQKGNFDLFVLHSFYSYQNIIM